MAIPHHLPLTKKSRSPSRKRLPPSFLSKWCECWIQIRASNREHGGNFLLLCYLKAKQLASHAKGIKWKITTNSLWILMLLKTHIALGQMVALCSALHRGERFMVQQGLFDRLRLTSPQHSSGFNESCSTMIDSTWLPCPLSPPVTSAPLAA